MKRLFFNFLWCLLILSPMFYWISVNYDAIGGSAHPMVNAGRMVYEKSGCPACHTRYVRKKLTDLVRYLPDDYHKLDLSQTAMAQRFKRYPLDMFSRRIGPDLEFSLLYQDSGFFVASYIKNPQAMYKSSVMPAYKNLFSEKLTDDEIFFALRSLKNKHDYDGFSRGDALMQYLVETSGN